MRRFVVDHNIARFEAALAACEDESERVLIVSLLDEARRDLAALDAASENDTAQSVRHEQGHPAKGE